jgi:signal transduction histidine kinase
VLARFLAQASFPATRDPQLQEILSQVVAGIDFPIVIADVDSLPRAWRQIGLDPGLVPAASIDSLAQGLEIAPVMRERIERVRSRIGELDRRNRPIEMRQPGTNVRLGYVHFGDPPVLDALRWLPYLSSASILLLLAIGFWGLSGLRAAENRSIWVGMARETAHQLGTPLSSLMGWVELLRSHAEPQSGDTIVLSRPELDETLEEMERDVERLRKVANRFSHVGSVPVLVPADVTPVVTQAVRYASRRLPRGAGDVSISERYDEVPPVNLNAELLEWAIENLLSNATSALDKRPGLIEVVVEKRKGTENVEIVIRDNGRGMTPAEQKRAFEPGYTTKRRGWGLGLALTRRVVEEYHGGRLFVRRSVPGEGTTMVVSFPT